MQFCGISFLSNIICVRDGFLCLFISWFFKCWLYCNFTKILMLFILLSTCISLLFLGFAAELLTTNKLSELACLALYLMYEKKQGKKSFWYPFIRELDRQRGRGQVAVESPLIWSESELAYLDGSHTRVIAA